MDQLLKVKVVARIRQSNISETYSSGPQQAVNINSNSGQGNGSQTGTIRNIGDNVSVAPTQMGSPKSILANAAQNLVANSSLDKDGKVCIFTASTTKEKPIYVAASGNPIKKQLLTEYVKTDKNIIQYRHSILENANIFKFDHAMSYKVNNHQLYKDQCEELVLKAMSQGISSTFVVVGPAKAGKKFTIKGGEQNEKGILTRAVDDLIRLSDLQSQSSGVKVTQRNKPVTVLFSIFAIYNNEVVDLLQKDPNEDELEEIELTFSGEFRKYYMKSRERLKSIGSGDQSIRRLHIIYKFQVFRNETSKSKSRVFNSANGGLFSTVTFVHCADFCKAKMPEFVILGDYLTDIATRKDANIMEVPAYTNSKLINYVNDSLNSGKDNSCVLLCNISGSYDYLTQSVDCLQYCAGIKERIDHYYEDVTAFNQDQEMINQLASPSNKSLPDLQGGLNSQQRPNSNSAFVSGEAGTFRNSQDGFNQQGAGRGPNGELLHVPQRDATYQFTRQRGQNPTGNEIQQDLSNLMKDIYTFTDQTNGLTEEEIKDWALDREAELKSIQNDISKLPQEEQKKFEGAQYRIQESLNFLQQIKKNALQLSQNRSPKSGGLGNSDDLGTLMSQYNRSKESVMRGSQDELARSYNQSQTDLQDGGNNQSYTYQNNTQGKRNMQELREQILNKIEEVINENDQSRKTVRVGGRESQDFNNEKSSKNLRQLKEMLADQDYLIQEKKIKLKQKNKELKEQQVEMRNQMQYLENDIKEKDAKVQYLEDQKEQLKEQIERDRDIIQLKMDKEELLEKNDEELRELIDRLKIKLQRRKQECLMLKDNIDKVEREVYSERIHFDEERNGLTKQINELSTLYEDERLRNQDIERINENFSYQIENNERLITKLQEDLQLAHKRYESVQQMYQEEQSLNKELRINQSVFEKRIDEAEDKAQVLEVKYNKLKRKCLEEKSQIAEEKDIEILRKKEATARLKNENKELEKRSSELSQDIKILKGENQKLSVFNEETQKDLLQKNRQIKDLSEELENVTSELKRQRNIQKESALYSNSDQIEKKRLIEDNERLNLTLRKLENNTRQLEKVIEEKNIYIEQLKKDVLLIDEETNGQKDLINKLERQNQYLSDVQHGDIERLESKIKSLNQEVHQLRKENKELKQRDNEQSLDISEFKIITDKQNDKLQKNKNIIKHLTTQLDQMDDKVKELIHDKNLEISHINHNVSRQNLGNDSIQRSNQAHYKNASIQQQQQQRSILKKPRFNLADSEDSDDSDI